MKTKLKNEKVKDHKTSTWFGGWEEEVQ